MGTFTQIKKTARERYWKDIVSSMKTGLFCRLAGGWNYWSSMAYGDDGTIRPVYHPGLVKLFASVQPAARPLLFLFIAAISIAFLLFVLHPLEYGCRSYFRHQDMDERVTMGFIQGTYLRVVRAYALRDLYILGGFLMFIIPGMQNVYRYYYLPEILEDHPDLSASEALRKCDEFTDGGKLMLLVFDLSFLGWDLLAMALPYIGFGYVYPYRYIAREVLYDHFEA